MICSPGSTFSDRNSKFVVVIRVGRIGRGHEFLGIGRKGRAKDGENLGLRASEGASECNADVFGLGLGSESTS